MLIAAVHAFMKCPQQQHFMHCIGLCLSLLGQILMLFMYRPSLIQVLVMLMSLSVKIAWAASCPGALWCAGLIHLALSMVPAGRLFDSLTSLRCLLLEGLKVSGTHGTRMEYMHLVNAYCEF